ncbi:MAG: hypothetical protein H6922_01635 [Pseudomonadaceae bacterium]|nr:hypothetical protein [Pseudomonadaceae bacterium]
MPLFYIALMFKRSFLIVRRIGRDAEACQPENGLVVEARKGGQKMDFGRHLAVFSTFTGLVVLVCLGVMSNTVAGASTPYEKQARINVAARELVLAKERILASEQAMRYHADMARHFAGKARRSEAAEGMLENYAGVLGHNVRYAMEVLSREYGDATRAYREYELEREIAADI